MHVRLSLLVALLVGCTVDIPGRLPDGGSVSSVDGSMNPGTTGTGGQNPKGDAGEDAGVEDAGTFVPYAYVGCGDGKIHRFAFNAADGGLSQKVTLNAGSNPSFLAFSPDAGALYAVDEGQNLVNAFAVATDGQLSVINSASSAGNGPTHLSLDRSGRWVLVANYGDGTTAVLPIQANRGVTTAVDVKTNGTNAHMIGTDAANTHAYVPYLGSNYVGQYLFNPATGALTPQAPPTVATAAGAGPRHFAFHPNGSTLYLVNELGNTITTFSIDSGGRLTPVETLGTLPGNVTMSAGAEVLVHPNGKRVYVSNRVTSANGDLAVFSVNAADGRLTSVGHLDTRGQHPRHMSLDPSGQILLVANQDSGNVVAFRVDPSTGDPTLLGVVTSGLSLPRFVGVMRVKQP